jgi:phosphoglycolate phosphatase-like HAD superfamily hydrolase
MLLPMLTLLLCGSLMSQHVTGQSPLPDPLPAWNNGRAKGAIIDFVDRVTKADGDDFVPIAERIAVFDNDGTLWTEQPMYVQLAFALDRLKTLGPAHSDWKKIWSLRAALAGDQKGPAASGQHGVVELFMATHTGSTTEEFEAIVKDWLSTAKHPKYNRLYTECVFQPMLELLGYLRANSFKTYIVSGGGVEFMRPWTERVYGIPPEQIIGSSVKTRFELRDDRPVLVRLPQIDFIDDKDGKPVAIEKVIGRRPIAAFGNSDGDLPMLQWTTGGKGARFGLLVHHTDGKREYAYDRKSPFGRLDKALDEAERMKWTVIDTQVDWKRIFSFDDATVVAVPPAE